MGHLTAKVRIDGDIYISWCPELDIFSHGQSVEEALLNLQEGIEDIYLAEDN